MYVLTLRVKTVAMRRGVYAGGNLVQMNLHIFGINGHSFEVEIQQLPFLGQAAASV